MTDRLVGALPGCVADIDRILEALPTRTEREPVLRTGEGGDDTTAIDAAAEDAVVTRLAALEADFLLVSEELGERTFGTGGADSRDRRPDRRLGERQARDPVLLALPRGRRGPVDGRRLLRLRLRLRRGRGVDGDAGRRREAGRRAARPRAGPKDPIEILSFEATTTAFVAEQAPALVGVAERLRVMGSLALSLCHLAAGRVDAVCSLKPARSIDIAAAQLLVRERGYAIELFEDPPFAERPSISWGARGSLRPRPRHVAPRWRPRSPSPRGSRGSRRLGGARGAERSRDAAQVR